MNPLQTAQSILHKTFGYERFRGLQSDIIDHVCTGGDALVLMPTGGGKSLCFQIPALVRPGMAVVISPLIALMQDQVEALRQSGVSAAFLNSSLSLEDQRDVERQSLNGELKLLYIAPERLNTDRLLTILTKLEISLFAIDEAHCVSQWGHDFRSDYLQLSILHQKFPNVPRIALTATADERTRHEIIQRLGLQEARLFLGGFDRPNIRYSIATKHNAKAQLLHFLREEHSGNSGIVYCLSRRKVDETAEFLAKQGFTALPYHAGLPIEERQTHQRRFLMEDSIIIVATIAFGMGIDKPNVRFVAHLDLPRSPEAYYQETGRAGRDGEPAHAWMVYGLQDVITLRQMVEGSEADETHKHLERHKLEAMLGLCEITSCRRQTLLQYFGEALQSPCGNCDNCLSPPKTFDGTEAARKALSCVYRSEQRFGAHHLVDILLGKNNERIERNGHQHLSTFGIGKELDQKQWLAIFRQLMTLGYLDIDIQSHGALKLTERCRPILRGETRLSLRKDEPLSTKAIHLTGRTTLSDEGNNTLWIALKMLRKELAEAQGVPPYVIFHDSVLMEMVERSPKSLLELRHLSGVGDKKLERYGESFLTLLRSYSQKPRAKPSLSTTAEETLNLFRQGMDVQKIASQRNIKSETVYDHLALAVRSGAATSQEVSDIPKDDIKKIKSVWLTLSDEEKRGTKALFEAYDGQYSYGQLRCLNFEAD